MNNNHDNLNVNSRMNNLNDQNTYSNNYFNSSNGYIESQRSQLNVIPQSQPENFGNNINQGFNNQQNNNISNADNSFYNNINTNYNGYLNNLNHSINQEFNNINSEKSIEKILADEEITIFQEPNKFITENQNNTALNDLNIDGDYNGLPKVDYSQDPKVMENIQSQNKKNTITITGEAKVFLIIIAVLLLFTFIMPTIFDYINDIQN